MKKEYIEPKVSFVEIDDMMEVIKPSGATDDFGNEGVIFDDEEVVDKNASSLWDEK